MFLGNNENKMKKFKLLITLLNMNIDLIELSY